MKSHYRQFLLIVIVFTFSVILAACGSKQNANETESTTGSKDDKQYHLKVGYLKMNGAPLADIAIHEGFLKKRIWKLSWFHSMLRQTASIHCKQIKLILV